MTKEQIDSQQVEEFAGRIVGMVNDGAIAVMVSIGHRTGLFDTMAELGPATIAEIAKATGLEERYVREWLGGVTVGRVVEYDPTTESYRLPPEHAASLTRAAGPGNVALLGRMVSFFGSAENDVVGLLREGGGLPYSAYPDFHATQAELTAGAFEAGLVDHVLPLVPELSERLTRGLDVLELGCGAGHATNLLAAAFPASRFTAFDLSDEPIAMARAEAEELGLANVTFEVKDVDRLDAQGGFDLVTAFDVIHDLPHPGNTLAAIARALRDDGVFLMADVAASSELHENVEHPFGPIIYASSLMHCMPVSLGQDGEGLGTAWGERRARELLAEAGFGQVEVSQIEDDPFNSYYVARPR